MMLAIFLFLGFLAVGIVGLLAVGITSQRLAQQPPISTFDAIECVNWVADHLDDEVTAVLSYDQLDDMVLALLAYFQDLGVAGTRYDPKGVGIAVVTEPEPLGFLLGYVAENKIELTDDQVLAVYEQCLSYLGAIGAIGTPVQPDLTALQNPAAGELNP